MASKSKPLEKPVTLTLRLTDEQLDQLKRRAEYYKLSLEHFIKTVVLYG